MNVTSGPYSNLEQQEANDGEVAVLARRPGA
jgi:hypothetical protein